MSRVFSGLLHCNAMFSFNHASVFKYVNVLYAGKMRTSTLIVERIAVSEDQPSHTHPRNILATPLQMASFLEASNTVAGQSSLTTRKKLCIAREKARDEQFLGLQQTSVGRASLDLSIVAQMNMYTCRVRHFHLGLCSTAVTV